MKKRTMVIYAPINTLSGYGANSRYRVKSLIELYKNEWDIKVVPCRWGSTPQNFIENNPEWNFLEEYFLYSNQLSYQPDVMIWITIPNEAKPIGKKNILITAGIETDICDSSWITGVNQMDLIIVPSQHSKSVFENSKFNTPDGKLLQLEKPVEVIHEGIDVDLFKIIEDKTIKNGDLYESINSIPEKFAYLFCSHWIGNTPIGEDRKNVGLLIKAFFETFKNRKDTPALILKTSLSNSSYLNRTEILKRIELIKKTVNSKKLPNIYLVHGDMSDETINELYNHPKIKAMVNLTKGEGYGRTLLEFSFTNKPIITTNWSGHIDFLNPEFTTLVNGTLTPIHPSAQVKNMLIEGSKWFSPNYGDIGFYLRDTVDNYKKYKELGKRQGYYSRSNFSYDKMKDKMKITFDKIMEDIPKLVELKLPTIPSLPKLPTLKKIN